MSDLNPGSGGTYRYDGRRINTSSAVMSVRDRLMSIHDTLFGTYTLNRAYGIRVGMEYRLYQTLTIATGASVWLAGRNDEGPWSVVSRAISVDRRGIRVRIFEGPFSQLSGGSPLVAFNANRTSDRTPKTVVKSGVTVAGGTQIDEFRVPGVSEQGQRRDTTQSVGEDAWVYAAGKDYAIQFTNTQQSGDPTTVHVNWAWQER